MSCGAMTGADGTPRGFECGLRTKVRYPGNDPENGHARPYCPDGHSTCYKCGRWFWCIQTTPGWTDEETGQVIPESKHEHDWCPECEAEERCTSCDTLLTEADIAANADDAIELTGGRGCIKCMEYAAQFVAPCEPSTEAEE